MEGLIFRILRYFTITRTKKIIRYIEVCYIEVPLYGEQEVKNRNRKFSQETKNSKQMSRTENSKQ